MIAAAVAQLVDFARRHAVPVAAAALLLMLAAGVLAATRLSIDTDIEHMLPSNVGWRQDEFALDEAFPQNNSLLVLVIDAKTPELADKAAAALAAGMRAEPEFFEYVRQPDGGAFFDQNGLFFLSVGELDSMSQDLVAAQPLIGSMAHDPSLRGLFGALATFVEAAHRGDVSIDKLNPSLRTIGGAVQSVLDGKPTSVSWGQMMTGRATEPRDLRRFVLTRPVLDFGGLEPGGKARAELRRLASELGLDQQHGVRLRVTGPVALDDEQFATLKEGALRSTVLSIVSVLVILFVALRSVKLVGAVLVTLAAGLIITAGFAAAAIGSLNLISIAFGVLFIGLAVDFSIQFSIRYRDERHRVGELSQAIERAGNGISAPLALAATTTAVGFFSFVPTAYSGVSELGLIAGTSMMIALFLNFTLLPATLRLLHPPGESEPVGYHWARGIDEFLVRRRRSVTAASAVVAAICVVLLPHWRFDFNPLNLKDPKTESVATLFDLMSDPSTTPYTIDVLAPSLAAADALARRIETLPEVAQVVTVSSYIPEDQNEKQAILSDAELLLGPTLSPPQTATPPDDAANLAAIATCARNLAEVSGSTDAAAARLARALDAAVQRGATILPDLRESILSGLAGRLHDLRLTLSPQQVTMQTLPNDLRRAWVTEDGRARLEVFPKGDPRDNTVLERFVAAVRTVAPEATGAPVTIQESGSTVVGAFTRAGCIAVIAITLLLLVVLRHLWDVLLVLVPLLFAGLLTAATSVMLDLPLNYANIITLPLLLGIGVAFDIYFVMRWRAGLDAPLQSSTARAVLFSALTTMTAFGSLALSSHPGTAEMGRLLTISLAYVLLCTLVLLPALQGTPTKSP